jgi:hypothetical protein
MSIVVPKGHSQPQKKRPRRTVSARRIMAGKKNGKMWWSGDKAVMSMEKGSRRKKIGGGRGLPLGCQRVAAISHAKIANVSSWTTRRKFFMRILSLSA